MKLYYYNAPKKNFGDDINRWLWDRLLPDFFDNSPDAWMSVIGTIINDKMPEAKTKVVFSSGAGYEAPPKDFGGAGWDIICVRGPLTAKVLGLSNNLAITDGAILLATLPEYKPIQESERKGIVFMPHHRALDYGYWEEVCKRANIEFISPRDDCHKSLQRIRGAKLVLADAMHAAIVADTFRVPWIPIVASSSINGFKWHDWTSSMEMAYAPNEMPSSNLAEISTRIPLNILGGLHVKGDSLESAIKDYENKLIKNRSISGMIEKKLRLGTAKTLRLCSRISEHLYVGKLCNDRLLFNAANSLQSISRQRQYLSKDSVFADRKERMLEKLEGINKYKKY